MLEEEVFALRGEDLVLDIEGEEHLTATADSIAPEAACTSTQLHIRVSPEDFAPSWNAAQAIASLQVAVGANSPYFVGRHLWQETRLALFEQSIDTRSPEERHRGERTRVWFGDSWISRLRSCSTRTSGTSSRCFRCSTRRTRSRFWTPGGFPGCVR